MKTKLWILVLFVILLGGLLPACNQGAAPGSTGAEPTLIPTVKVDTSVVVEGKLVPSQSVELSFVTDGRVDEVFVEVGDQVKAGDVLARLGDREALQASIANAELDLLNAQQALDELDEQATAARTEALRRIGDLNKVVRDAKYQLDNYTVPVDQSELDPMEAVSIMKQKLEEAQAAFEPYKTKSEGDPTRRQLKEKLDQAQSDYNTAVRRLEYVIALETAEADLAEAMLNYDDVKDGPESADVEVAQARIKAAEAALNSAKADLDNLELLATIDGTIVDVDLIVGEQVTPAQAVIKIADFSQWFVETDNLTEIDVVNVSIGQKVQIVPDALPDLSLSGVVDSIQDISEEKRGDVTYTVSILLDNVDPRLRWGMTVLATFQE